MSNMQKNKGKRSRYCIDCGKWVYTDELGACPDCFPERTVNGIAKARAQSEYNRVHRSYINPGWWISKIEARRAELLK